MKDSEIIKQELGIDIVNDPDGIDKLIEHVGDNSDAMAGDSEDISCITEDED